MNDLSSLIERVKAAPNMDQQRELIAQAFEALGHQVRRAGDRLHDRSWAFLDKGRWRSISALLSSVDAVLALIEDKLPGWEMERTVTDTGVFIRLVGPKYIQFEFMGERNPHKTVSIAVSDRRGRIRTDALALLTALLAALLTALKEQSNG